MPLESNAAFSAAAITRDPKFNVCCRPRCRHSSSERGTRVETISEESVEPFSRRKLLADGRITFDLWANAKDEPRPQLARLVQRRTFQNRRPPLEHEP